ncbi:hypothetical protein Lal_00036593 [Lupinus albus]|uniref:Putative PWWP domain-containing protein n=1 Tax=Lupinus albus TaxID=3870 RepID=A0A6A5P574_LUPAL|nr:putative PWWP domain-containing protein [Lupinus albus]KAF1892232.1 hypothetical protein Lal_00036593 [Lupinus albus]
MSQIHPHQHSITADPKPDSPVTELQSTVSPNAKILDSETQHSRVTVSSEVNFELSGQNTVDRFDDLNNRTEKFSCSDTKSKSLLSEFDDYVAGKRNSDLGHGFEIGDMVWGKVKSHPWWPGHIYNEAFVSPSVRRTKREGNLLVAFFGDSSYGWFEPAELIHFDPNFAEKSQQTNSRTFLKALEEAVDEASRRSGLGLVCKCGNTGNFRRTDVKGYLSVDVPDYEPGGFYSSNEIRKARSSFRPSEALAFAKQLALSPRDGDHGSIGYIKNKAMAFAYRKAVFEQHDETYAQAFGLQPSRHQNNTNKQPSRQPSRAPLSGPMVTGEALGSGKNTTKSVKVKGSMKKDKYLFKRRDDPNNSFQIAYKEETPDATGHDVLQKGAPAVPVVPHNVEKNEDTEVISHDVVTSTSDAKAALIDGTQPDGSGLASKAISSDVEPHLVKGKESPDEMTHNLEQGDVSSKSLGKSDLSVEVPLLSIIDQNAKQSGPDFANGGNDLHQAKHHEIALVKKTKGHKRPADNLNSKTSATGERKKKKKKDLNLQPAPGHLEKHSTSGKFVHLSGKPVPTAMAPTEDLRAEQVQGDFIARNLPPMDPIGDANFELPQLLDDLQALALDPFHDVEGKIPAAVLKFFLHFRSLVYRKSLSSSPPTENEHPVALGAKSPLTVKASDSPGDHVRASPVVKPAKHFVRPDDPTKAGRKRAPSDRQEEIAAKRLNKITDLKALAAEKAAASQKTSEARRGEEKDSTSQAAPKLVKPDSNRKVQRPAKVVEPTMLVIKFPPQTSLPSVAELKARFVRFGPMDQSGFRVFWKSSTCRVVFLYRADALSAYKYSVANPSLFGTAGVRYFLRESEDSTSEVSVAAKAREDNGAANETLRLKDPAAAHHPTSLPPWQPLPQPMTQLKSCLKKSTGDESGQSIVNGGSNKGNSRVKFMLGGEESSSKMEPLIMGNRNINNASFAGGAPPIAMDFNSKNFVHLVTSQPPLLPTPPATTTTTQLSKTPQHNLHNSELAMAPKNTPNFINTPTKATTTSTTVDISQQMISLLMRCNDVVNNLSGLLGYVPYHQL